jgi:anti-sigma-K factor RskA
MSDDDHARDFDAETLSIVEQSLPRVTPPDDLFGRILAEVVPGGTVVPLERTRRRRAAVAAAGLVAVAAIVLLAILISAVDHGAPVDGRAAIAGQSDPSITGEAVLYGATADGGTVHVSLRGVPPAPAGHHYEIWVLRRGGTQMEAVGTFTPTSSDVDLDLPLPGPGDYAAVDVSVEEDGGSPTHSDTSLAGGTFD